MPLVDVPTADFNARPLETPQSRALRAQQARRGVRSRQVARGRVIGFGMNSRAGKVHAVGSVVAQLASGAGLADGVSAENIRYQKIAGRGRRNILFLVDTSGSMLSAERLAMVKGCVVSLLRDAYVQRMQVAVVGYGGARAKLVLPFTSSAEMAARCIGEMKGGGTTPLLGALELAVPLIESLDGEPVEIVLLSDGRYDRPVGLPADRLIRNFGAWCAKRDSSILVIDAGGGHRTARKRAVLLARNLHARFRTLDGMRADALYSQVLSR